MVPALEVADIFRRHGEAFRQARAGHLGYVERRIMGAITACRTAVLGGHVEQCDGCGATRIAYNSCRNRHCPKCQGLARAKWLADRQAELLPVPYFHVVFTLPAPVGEIAFQNKAAVGAILFRTAAETLATIAADRRHLGAKLGVTMVLHTWGQSLQYHPHVHCIVPGGGPSLDGTRWVACRPGFFLPVRVLSRLFRRLFLQELKNAFAAGKLRFFSNLANLAEPQAFARRLGELRRLDWVVYAKPPFGGPEQVLAYLGRYTHRVAIANSRLISLSDGKVRFTWKDYRQGGKTKVMTLEADEFIRRFLLHALPDGFHRIRHYGILANGSRGESLARCHRMLDARDTGVICERTDNRTKSDRPIIAADFAICPDCGGTMRPIATVPRACNPQPFSCDTS
jgi:Putative transposase/Transposase zinc-binding domain